MACAFISHPHPECPSNSELCWPPKVVFVASPWSCVRPLQLHLPPALGHAIEGSESAALRGGVQWDRDMTCLFILLKSVRFFLFLFLTSSRFVFLTMATQSFMKQCVSLKF